ncbi:fatty acid desaturase [Microlunatus panaciterrae]|uniref:Stearoyl-CoA desaturase (Delta-9 desaturase) n=1 Tax=Microlunatus panaciterrae TaxID=400768 RepID=A0ABS2RGD8_9ACTN|nr:acyl-CoA desaturase [Microlunatus panaciterrae]MBM7798075.1 stearoyl-CoA desaturase (delta-9 desaturase) [Microlunatus panaciterrae]
MTQAPPAPYDVAADSQVVPEKRLTLAAQIALGAFIVVPFLALLVAVPMAWGGWLGWKDVVLFLAFYMTSGMGITVGFHRYFTHKSFKPNRGLKIALAIAGSLAIQGPVIRWVADHRKHHKFSDRDGDPHSPWRYGTSVGALTRGLVYAHMLWMFNPEQTPRRQYAPDLMKDPDLVKVDKAFPAILAFSLLGPALIGGLWSMSWTGAATAFFWASLVRIGLLHHVTWSINSICHAVGQRPFKSRDKSGNVWWLALLSHGESWHNLHHADPTCARHGVLPGQIDTSARVIWFFEKFGWAREVRWPVAERVEARRVADTLG